jgi:hypothetical protein
MNRITSFKPKRLNAFRCKIQQTLDFDAILFILYIPVKYDFDLFQGSIVIFRHLVSLILLAPATAITAQPSISRKPV